MEEVRGSTAAPASDASSAHAGASDASSIIGKFGVGFYSSFMVAERVDVVTRTREQGAVGWRWTSDG